MGLYAAKNAVYVAAKLQLGGSAARLFLHMPLECWDDDDNPGGQAARRYFGRRELSAIALGFLAPDNGSDAAFQAVKRATKELVVTEITGMSERTLASLRYRGTGPRFYQPTRKTILYRRSEVLAWVEASAKTRSLASSRA